MELGWDGNGLVACDFPRNRGNDYCSKTQALQIPHARSLMVKPLFTSVQQKTCVYVRLGHQISALPRFIVPKLPLLLEVQQHSQQYTATGWEAPKTQLLPNCCISRQRTARSGRHVDSNKGHEEI